MSDLDLDLADVDVKLAPEPNLLAEQLDDLVHHFTSPSSDTVISVEHELNSRIEFITATGRRMVRKVKLVCDPHMPCQRGN